MDEPKTMIEAAEALKAATKELGETLAEILKDLAKDCFEAFEEVEEREWNQACWRNSSYRYNIHQKQRNTKPKVFRIRNHTRKMKKGQRDR